MRDLYEHVIMHILQNYTGVGGQPLDQIDASNHTGQFFYDVVIKEFDKWADEYGRGLHKRKEH